MNLKKFSMLLFIIGVLISVFSGSFEIVQDMRVVKVVFLIFLGVIIGLLNVNEDQETDFLIACIAFIIGSQAIISVMQNLHLLNNLGIMLTNLMIFISPAAVIIGLKKIFMFASESDVDLRIDPPKKIEKNKLEQFWDIVLLVSISFVFIILILDSSFFDVSNIREFIDTTDFVINIIFVIDLVVLYRKSRGFVDFLKINWIDVIAVIPLGSLFRVAKVIRAVRIVKILSRGSKVSRIAKVSSSTVKTNRFFKFFSNNSGFNKYVDYDDSGKTSVKKAKDKKASKKTTKRSPKSKKKSFARKAKK
ncbi:MAG: hypothetical protein ACLFPQ_03420 [Candidatus Woesearchaeota archaeon]